MPIYEYRCSKCGKTFEKIQKFVDPPVEVHEDCGGPVERLISTSALQFKGSGFYITDYAKGSSKPGESKSDHGHSEHHGDSKSDSKGEGKSESKSEGKGESKSESKSDSKSESGSGSKSSESQSSKSSGSGDSKSSESHSSKSPAPASKTD